MCDCTFVPGSKFGRLAGAAPGVCTCCSAETPVVKLPVGEDSAIYNCVTCLYPQHIGKRQKPKSDLEKSQYNFKSDLRTVYLPASLVMALKRDGTQIPNVNPSAQAQKAFDNAMRRKRA